MEGGQRGLVRALSGARAAGAWLRDALFPDFCGGCGRERTLACTACWSLIPLVGEPQRLDGLPVWSVTTYQEPVVRGIVHALKYGRRPEARELIREALGRWPAAATLRATAWTLVPIPMHPARLRRRGRNQALVLAEVLADAGMGRVADVLVRGRRTRSQTELGRAARARNVAGAFSLGGAVDPAAACLLVDDVVTSGATLAAAAETLAAGGVARVAAWTFAAD